MKKMMGFDSGYTEYPKWESRVEDLRLLLLLEVI